MRSAASCCQPRQRIPSLRSTPIAPHATAGAASGTGAWSRPRVARALASSASPRAMSVSTDPGARTGSSRRHARGPARCAGHDLPELAHAGCPRTAGPSRRGRGALRADRTPAWPQSSTTILSITSVSVELDGADRAVGDDQRAGRDPRGPQQRRRFGQPRRLDHHVGAAHALLPADDRAHLAIQVGAQALGRTAHGSSDRRECTRISDKPGQHPAQQTHVPVGGAPSADMAEHGRHRGAPSSSAPIAVTAPGAHLGDRGGVDDRRRHAGGRVHQQQQGQLRR